VVSHNIETVERLTRQVRIQAKYWRSMEVLKSLKRAACAPRAALCWASAKQKKRWCKPCTTLYQAGCDVVTIGQYLQPTKKHLPVQRFVHPDEFAEYRQIGYSLGLDYVESGPLVRSSYHSERHVVPGLGKTAWENEKVFQ
jgi:lipoic acid synthetase